MMTEKLLDFAEIKISPFPVFFMLSSHKCFIKIWLPVFLPISFKKRRKMAFALASQKTSR